MDLDVNMRTGSCPYAVQFYGALFREVSISCNCCHCCLRVVVYRFAERYLLCFKLHIKVCGVVEVMHAVLF